MRVPPIDPTHTLGDVLDRLQADPAVRSPELAERLDRAFGKHQGALLRACRAQLPGFSEQKVQELVQEVLLEAWRKLPEYRPDAPFRSFLWAIARMKCANARRKRCDALSADGLLADVSDGSRNALSALGALERDELVDQAAANVLDPTDRELVHLRWVLDLPLDEISERLGLQDSNAVRVGLQRCKRRMQKEIPRLLAERDVGESFLWVTR